MNKLQEVMVQQFQCPGCINGPFPACFKQINGDIGCNNHVAGTIIFPGGEINLGLPKGFNKLGPIDISKQKSNIRIYKKIELDHYDKFNVPV